MPVPLLQSQIDAAHFNELQAYLDLFPHGQDVEWFRHALLCQLLSTIHSGKTKLDDFIPDFTKDYRDRSAETSALLRAQASRQA
jgi:hypothetical protein